jgi:hypothetical protein
MRAAIRSRVALVLAGAGLVTLLLSGAEAPHEHDDGIFNEECELSALAALGGCAMLEPPPVVVAVVLAVVAATLPATASCVRSPD